MARRRRGGFWRGLLIFLLVTAALFVGADHLARTKVEQLVRDQVMSQITSAESLDVQMDGWPFLAVLATDEVSGELNGRNIDAVVEGKRVHAIRADAKVNALKPARDPANGTAESIYLQMQLDWATLENLIGRDVTFRYVDGSRMAISTQTEVFGVTVPINVIGDVDLSDPSGKLSLTNAQADVLGVDVPQGIIDGVTKSVADDVRLPSVAPLQYQSLRLAADGPAVAVAGHNVEVSKIGK